MKISAVLILGVALTATAATPKPIHPSVHIISEAGGDSVEAKCPNGLRAVDTQHLVKPNMTNAETYAAFRAMVCVPDHALITQLDPHRHDHQPEPKHFTKGNTTN